MFGSSYAWLAIFFFAIEKDFVIRNSMFFFWFFVFFWQMSHTFILFWQLTQQRCQTWNNSFLFRSFAFTFIDDNNDDRTYWNTVGEKKIVQTIRFISILVRSDQTFFLKSIMLFLLLLIRLFQMSMRKRKDWKV